MITWEAILCLGCDNYVTLGKVLSQLGISEQVICKHEYDHN